MTKNQTAPRILSVLAALLLLITSLTACSGGVTREEAKTAMDSLLTALGNENYAEAAALYHPDAAMTEELLAAFAEEVKTKVGIDLTEGATAEKIHAALLDCPEASEVKIFRVESFEQALLCARANAAVGGCVLLSPASASFDQFKNFSERGQRFKELVLELK